MHRVTEYCRTLEGIEAISLDSDCASPRHTHDEFGIGIGIGIGIIDRGAQRSWSGRGAVDAHTGDAIMVNPGEVHDGAPLGITPGRA